MPQGWNDRFDSFVMNPRLFGATTIRSIRAEFSCLKVPELGGWPAKQPRAAIARRKKKAFILTRVVKIFICTRFFKGLLRIGISPLRLDEHLQNNPEGFFQQLSNLSFAGICSRTVLFAHKVESQAKSTHGRYPGIHSQNHQLLQSIRRPSLEDLQLT